MSVTVDPDGLISHANSDTALAKSIEDEVRTPMKNTLDAVNGKWGTDSYGQTFASSLPSEGDMLSPLDFVTGQLTEIAGVLKNAAETYIQAEKDAEAYFKQLGEQA
ncbi:WXG100 family type VII secretion target [Nocardia alni]|uniref:WXG100 family type VII secretion target n=1 Tax=Nocardia alni TaxID=2815723 RepID=UPI001C23DF9B|nr:WXG100 family type VII secretion target [Nocardia alni]